MAFFVLQNPEEMAGRRDVSPLNGKTECVEFVRKVTCAPHTDYWRPGTKVQGNEHKIPRGTVIATFNEKRLYEGHAAIFLRLGHKCIHVMDQYASKDQVSERQIRYKTKRKSRLREKRANTNQATTRPNTQWCNFTTTLSIGRNAKDNPVNKMAAQGWGPMSCAVYGRFARRGRACY